MVYLKYILYFKNPVDASLNMTLFENFRTDPLTFIRSITFKNKLAIGIKNKYMFHYKEIWGSENEIFKIISQTQPLLAMHLLTILSPV